MKNIHNQVNHILVDIIEQLVDIAGVKLCEECCYPLQENGDDVCEECKKEIESDRKDEEQQVKESLNGTNWI